MALSVGFIGVGNMGNPMAGNVLKSGRFDDGLRPEPPAMKNLIDAGARPRRLRAGGGGAAARSC